ncbi:MAG: sulfatase [Armatimonadota bacterium]
MGLTAAGGGLLATTLPQEATAQAGAGEGGKLNVLFIPVDDLRPQLGCYGHEQMISPNIDRLAASGTAFLRAYCQQAVCAPSRASLLSGCRPDTTRVYDLRTPLRSVMPEVVTLPQHFRNHDYHTVSLGKVYHHGRRDDPPAWSEDPWSPSGAFPGYASPEARALCDRLWEEGGREGQRRSVKGSPTEAYDAPDNAYADGKLTDKAIEAMRELRDRPFFLGVGYYKPHLAFCCPQRYWDLYRREEIDLADNPFRPKGAPDIALHNWGELRAYYGIPKQGPVSDEQARELIHGYYACVSFIDAQVGRLMDELEALGLSDKTVVVLWGDHGWNLGEHGLWCKHCNYETSTHSPMIVSVPGQKAPGGKSEALTEFVDIYPSLCEACGLPTPEHVEGTSFAPLLDDPDREWKTAAFSQYPRGGGVMGYSMKTDRYRYTEWIRAGEEVVAVELYDHQTDPAENVNIAVESPDKALLEELSKRLHAGWRGHLPPA